MSWTDFNKSYNKFVKAGKNIPGVLIDVLFEKKRHLYLIGHINPLASAADGGMPFPGKAIVVKYKYIWSENV